MEGSEEVWQGVCRWARLTSCAERGARKMEGRIIVQDRPVFKLVSSTENREGTLVGGLERFPEGFIAYEHLESRVQMPMHLRRFVLGASRDRTHNVYEFP